MIKQPKQEQELLESYRKLRPETKRRIMDTVITAFSAVSAAAETAVSEPADPGRPPAERAGGTEALNRA